MFHHLPHTIGLLLGRLKCNLLVGTKLHWTPRASTKFPNTLNQTGSKMEMRPFVCRVQPNFCYQIIRCVGGEAAPCAGRPSEAHRSPKYALPGSCQFLPGTGCRLSCRALALLPSMSASTWGTFPACEGASGGHRFEEPHTPTTPTKIAFNIRCLSNWILPVW